MTVEGYYAEVRRLGLRPTKHPTVFQCAQGEFHRVPIPTDHTPAQRAETIQILKELMGVSEG